MHRALGYAWAALLLFVAISGLFIRTRFEVFEYFSPIHLLSVITIVAVLRLPTMHAS